MNPRTIRAARRIAAIGLVLCAPFAVADDNSMSVLTGDSYAYFNDLDYHPGHFNTPRQKPATARRDDSVTMPENAPQAGARPILLAERPRVTLQSPFRDDKGA